MSADVPKLEKGASVSDAARLIADEPYGCVVVVDKNNPIGIVTESDVLKNLVYGKGSLGNKVEKIMSVPITSLSPRDKLEKASKIIDTKHFRRYPVVDNGVLVGIVTENIIVDTINRNIRFHRNLQNTILVIFVAFEFFVFVLYKHIIAFFS